METELEIAFNEIPFLPLATREDVAHWVWIKWGLSEWFWIEEVEQ